VTNLLPTYIRYLMESFYKQQKIKKPEQEYVSFR
jgi:hypothetical protein